MTELELYKFIYENKIEFHWETKDYKNNVRDVLIMVSYHELEDFDKLLPNTFFDDGGRECIMQKGYFCFWMQDICDYFGIDMEKVFGADKIH